MSKQTCTMQITIEKLLIILDISLSEFTTKIEKITHCCTSADCIMQGNR